jgi:hypothetical protein
MKYQTIQIRLIISQQTSDVLRAKKIKKAKKQRLHISAPAPGTPFIELLQTPAALLLITGTLIGLNFPLGKIAGEAGVSPMIWALLISFGATLVLLPLLIVTRALAPPPLRVLRYTVISALVSFIN